MPEKIIRTNCLFTKNPEDLHLERLAEISARLKQAGFSIQTHRLCSPNTEAVYSLDETHDGSIFLSLGTLPFENAVDELRALFAGR